jgi:hypothetical protein
MSKLSRISTVLVVFLATPCAAPGGPTSEQVSPDGIWRTAAVVPQLRAGAELWIQPDLYQYIELDANALVGALNRAPMEFSPEAVTSPLLMTFPMPDGSFARFEVVESPIMEPALAAKFPEIRTYLGRGIDDPSASVRFDWTPLGFHAQILSPSGAVYIDPLWKGDTTAYASYYKRYYNKGGDGFQCLSPNEKPLAAPIGAGGTAASTGETLRTYRLACAGTGEYTAYSGGTVTAGLSAIATAVNRITGVYETEVSVRMILVADNDLIVYTDDSADPYTNSDGVAMLGQNQSNLNSVIGSANYDIGHVFSTRGGGVANLGVVCAEGSKACGVTGLSNPNGDAYWIDYVAHEMGHQFGSNHCFNGMNGNCSGGNRHGSTAYEPGSGSTIMAYAGICGVDDLQAHSDPYFHSVSFDEIRIFTQFGTGNSCAVQSPTGNSPPTVDAGPDYTIPRNTPFTLTAQSGNDPDGDAVTYCWEQRDLGAAQALSFPDNGTSPILRTWNPTTSPTRTVPRLSNLLNNTLPIGEKYPAVNRTMDFRVMIRDNRAGGGGSSSDNMVVTVTTLAGPFEVTYPNAAATVSDFITVTWNVANTDLSRVYAANVDIYLSTDGGYTFPTVLASNTPNDGSEQVRLPGLATSTARIKVQGSGNIFFDISDANFIVVPNGALVSPSAEPSPVVKNRYLTCKPENSLRQTALRVTLADLPEPFTAFIGQTRWVGPPQSYTETTSPATTFMAAALQCDPHFMDWSTVGVVQIYGAEIVPDAEYDIQTVSYDPGNEAEVSAPLMVMTGRWGDVVAPINPTLRPDVDDISAVVDKFKDVSGAVSKARAQLYTNVPNPSASVDFSDIAACVDAYKGQSYPFPGPSNCP